MAGIDEFSTTAASNTTINSIPLSDSTLPNQVDNAIRQFMADMRAFANDSGAKPVSSGDDTITLTTETTYTAYVDGIHLAFIAGGTNTGAATLNVDGVGAKAIVKSGGTALAAGNIVAGMVVLVYYDASQGSGSWMLANPIVGGLTEVADDTSPTLGGPLDAGGFDINNGGVLFLTEQAAAEADVAGKGQFWVETATPNVPKFTDDAGTDFTLATKADLVGKQTIWIPASAMTAAGTNGPASALINQGSGAVNLTVLDFDASTDESAHFHIAMPKGWNEGTVTFKVWWRSNATDTDGVAWALEAGMVGDSDFLSSSYGTAVVVTDDAHGTSADDVYITAESSAITIANTPAEGEMTIFRLFRDVSDANDDMTEDARLIGIQLFYTTNALTDA